MFAQANLVLALTAVFYGAAILLVFDLLIHRRDPFRSARRPRFRGIRAAVFALATLGLIALTYAYFVEPYWPEVTSVTVRSSRVPRGSQVRIVHLTDLHSDPKARLEERLPDMIAEFAPDLIVFTGDALNDERGAKVFRRSLSRIASIAPTYAVRGNWDVWFWQDVDLYRDTGVHELNGQSAHIQIRGVSVWLGGAAVEDTTSLKSALSAVPKDAFSIFLHHYPERVELGAAAGVDLMLAGDTHGGQVRLPLLGPLVKMSRFGGFYDAGLHQVGATQLYVSRGIGMEGGDTPRMRFLCRPEIAVIDVTGP